MRQQTRALLIAASVALLHGCSSRPLPDACYQPPASGKCRAAIERYYFDPYSNRCKAFIWGGCEGLVPFRTLESCNETCASIENAPQHDGEQHE